MGGGPSPSGSAATISPSSSSPSAGRSTFSSNPISSRSIRKQTVDGTDGGAQKARTIGGQRGDEGGRLLRARVGEGHPSGVQEVAGETGKGRPAVERVADERMTHSAEVR